MIVTFHGYVADFKQSQEDDPLIFSAIDWAVEALKENLDDEVCRTFLAATIREAVDALEIFDTASF